MLEVKKGQSVTVDYFKSFQVMSFLHSTVTRVCIEASLLAFVVAISHYLMTIRFADKSTPVTTVAGARANDYPSDTRETEISNERKPHSQPLTNRCPQTTDNTSNLIVSILERFRMSDGEGERKALGVVPKFLAQIERCIARDEPVCMVLPAFPFKSVNKTTKVLGSLPDKGEEVALRHLDHMCQAIREVYKYGARVYIVSDGLVYNGRRRPAMQ